MFGWLLEVQASMHPHPSSRKSAKLLENNPEKMREIETIGIVARRGISALMDGDMEAVGRAMGEITYCSEVGSILSRTESLISAAAPSSLGVKLTGAGGGGYDCFDP